MNDLPRSKSLGLEGGCQEGSAVCPVGEPLLDSLAPYKLRRVWCQVSSSRLGTYSSPHESARALALATCNFSFEILAGLGSKMLSNSPTAISFGLDIWKWFYNIQLKNEGFVA